MGNKMLPLLVFCYVLYIGLTSFILSAILPFRSGLSRLYGIVATFLTDNYNRDDAISLYEGTVSHERRHPVHHSFKLSVRYALIDMDRSSYLPPNHLSADEARSIAETNGPVLLLTIPPSVGYQRSPVSVYYCYHQGSSIHLKYCIGEVYNTPWGERVQYLFSPDSDVVAKPLHVSPFMDMFGDWHMKTRSPGKQLSVTVVVEHPVFGKYFTASLTAKRVEFTSKVDHAIFFWLMPHKAAIYTYWQSFKLLLKNVQFIEHPKYKRPGYIEDSLMVEERRGCCMAHPMESTNTLQIDRRRRWYAWKGVQYWPWT